MAQRLKSTSLRCRRRSCWATPPRPAGCANADRHLLPYLPDQSGYNKHQRRAAGLIGHAIHAIATDTGLWTDDVWIADSPVECGRSKETAKRCSCRVGLLRLVRKPFALILGTGLHLVGTLHGLPVAFALTVAKAADREVLLDLLTVEPQLLAARSGQILLANRNYYGHEFERILAELGVRLMRPARKGEAERLGALLFKPLRQLIESVNQTFKAARLGAAWRSHAGWRGGSGLAADPRGESSVSRVRENRTRGSMGALDGAARPTVTG